MKKIAIIGSSGGNLYNLGGAEPEKLLQEIYQQCEAAGVTVAAVQFIAAEASMDVAKPDPPAAVYALTTENNTKPQRIFQGKLSEVNASVVESDRQIAGMIRRGEVDGIVVMSADPVKANQAVFDAAVEMKNPDCRHRRHLDGAGRRKGRQCGRHLRHHGDHQPHSRGLFRRLAV